MSTKKKSAIKKSTIKLIPKNKLQVARTEKEQLLLGNITIRKFFRDKSATVYHTSWNNIIPLLQKLNSSLWKCKITATNSLSGLARKLNRADEVEQEMKNAAIANDPKILFWAIVRTIDWMKSEQK